MKAAKREKKNGNISDENHTIVFSPKLHVFMVIAYSIKNNSLHRLNENNPQDTKPTTWQTE